MQRPTLRFVNSNPETTSFFATLRKNVDNYFKENNISRHYNKTVVIKTIALLSAYIIPFVFLLIFQPGLLIAIPLWVLMGFAIAGIGMCVMHDGNHGAFSSNRKVNFIMGHSLSLLGGSVFNWKLQHNVLHHTYTNIPSMDDDIDTKLMMRFSPTTKVRWFHKLQFIYAFLFYGILTIYWVTFKDIVQFVRYTREGVNKNNTKENIVLLLKILFGKICYYGVFVFLPLYILGMAALPFLFGFVLMLFISGIILSVIFQLAHMVEETQFPTPNENNTIENCWAIHQLATTANFSRKSKIISWYVGGLNFQIEHHLFPSICHVHYPHIAPIVKNTALQFGIPYLEHETFWKAFKSHIRSLQKLGGLSSLSHAIS